MIYTVLQDVHWLPLQVKLWLVQPLDRVGPGPLCSRAWEAPGGIEDEDEIQQVNHGKNTGKPRENHGETMGKPWKNDGFIGFYGGFMVVL